MEQVTVIDAATDIGSYEATTASGTSYLISRPTQTVRWHVKRFPGPGASLQWLDSGGRVHRISCVVGAPAQFEVSGGYLDADLWARSSTVTAIVRLPAALTEAEAAYVRANSGSPSGEANHSATESAEATARGDHVPAPPGYLVVAELAGVLHVDGASFSWRTPEELALIMSTPHSDLMDNARAPMTPWAWLAAGHGRGPILELLEGGGGM